MSDELIEDHVFVGEARGGASCQYISRIRRGAASDPWWEEVICGRQSMDHAVPARGASQEHLINSHPHDFVSPPEEDGNHCAFVNAREAVGLPPEEWRRCGYPQELHDRWMAAGRTLAAAGLDLASSYALPEHTFVRSDNPNFGSAFGGSCDFQVDGLVCGWPERAHRPTRGVPMGKPVDSDAARERLRSALPVRMADVAQYAREPMPEEARKGITVTLLDAPVDPLGTLAVLSGIYEGRVARSKSDVTDMQRVQAWEAMQATVLSGPLEAIQFTFLVEGVSRAITHQMVRNRFSFFAQESLRFAVAEDWAQEIPLPPSLAGKATDDPAVTLWRRLMNQTEDGYAALIGAGMPAEEARGVLPHAITTRLYWTVSLRTLLMEAGKRTCTQAQFDWRILFAGVAKAFRDRAKEGENVVRPPRRLPVFEPFLDNWQYEVFADAIRPVCYQQGKCGFMAKFDRGCTIRERVDANERVGRPSSEWDRDYTGHDHGDYIAGIDCAPEDVPVHIRAIDPREWAADPSAARVKGEGA